MAEINTTPLVDVMLVLLVIFMVTAPLFTHAVRIDLPRARSEPSVTRADTVALSIDAEGRVRWNGEPIERTQLRERLVQTAAAATQPEVHLRAHRETRYQTIAELLSEAQRAGIRRFGLITGAAPRFPNHRIRFADAGCRRAMRLCLSSSDRVLFLRNGLVPSRKGHRVQFVATHSELRLRCHSNRRDIWLGWPSVDFWR